MTYFSQHPSETVANLAAHLGCSKRSAERIVASLRDEGLLQRDGPARGGVWIVRRDATGTAHNG